MPVSPFASYSPQFTWRQATWAAAVAAVGYLPGKPVKDVLKASPYFCVNVEWAQPATDLQNNIAFIDAGGTMWVGIEGTKNLTQALAFVAEDGLERPWGDGRGVFRAFYNSAVSCLIDIKARVSKTKPLVLTGHSLGGAAAMIAADLLKQDGYDVRGVVTFGQPFTANEAYANSYAVPLDRVIHSLDIVPRWPRYRTSLDTGASLIPFFPRELLGVARRPLVHAGIPRSLDQEGAEDELVLFLDLMKELGTPLGGGRVSRHLMGQYVGLCYAHLGPEGKALFTPLVQALSTTDSFALLNAAFPAWGPNVIAMSLPVIKAEELAFAATLLGPASKVKIRLFKGAFVDPEPGETFTPEEADFPGYAPILPHSNAPISGGGGTPVKIGPSRVTWTATEGPFPPHLVGGVYVTYQFEVGGEKKVCYVEFPDAVVVSEPGQQITVEVEAILSRFSD